jgi:hypothetical protein
MIMCLIAHSFYIFIAVLLIPSVHATADPFTKEELAILPQHWFSIHANPSLWYINARAYINLNWIVRKTIDEYISLQRLWSILADQPAPEMAASSVI